MPYRGKKVDVNDRRLRPLYDSLDNNENKRTVQEADKLLKKNPTLFCAKALKALALVRLSRREEAEGLLTQLEVLEELDENTIQALTACFKEMHDYKGIARLYERMCEKRADEEQLSHLFMAHLRLQDFSKLQTVAIKLHKLNPDNKDYAYWNISCYLLQSLKDPENGDRLYLKMAETWASKCLKQDGMNKLSEALLYMRVLEKRKKFEELHELLTTSLREVVRQEDQLVHEQLLRRVLHKLKRWSQAYDHATTFLTQNPDDFLVFQYFFRSAHRLWHPSITSHSPHSLREVFESTRAVIEASFDPCNGSSDTVMVADDADAVWVKVASFINVTIKSTQTNVPRGPYLAQMELVLFMKHLSSHQPYHLIDGADEEDDGADCGADDDELVKKTHELWLEVMAPLQVSLMVRYACQFGSKPCAFNDLRRFIDHLPPQLTPQMVQSLREALGFAEEDASANNITLITTEKAMWKHLLLTTIRHYCLHKCLYTCGGDDVENGGGDDDDIGSGDDDDAARSRYLLEYFKHGLTFGTHLNSTETQPAEGYLLVRTQQLLSLYQRKGSVAALLEAIVDLEGALKTSPCSHPLKITLIMLCSLLGDTEKCLSLFNSMDVKYIQLDSIGYLVSCGLELNGDTRLAYSFHQLALKFFESAPHELVNYIVMTFKCNNYHKTEELISFKHRLDHSLQLISSTISSALLSITPSIHHYESLCKQVSSLQWPFNHLPLRHVSYNRDLDVACILFNADKEAYKEAVKKEEFHWLLIQYRILSFLSSSVKQTNQSINQQLEQPKSDLKNGHQEKKTVEMESKTANNNIEGFDLKSCLLFNESHPLQDFEKIASSARHFLKERKSKSMFPTPLHHFLHFNLHSSLLQFSSLHQSITSVTQDPSLDESAQKVQLRDLQIYKIMTGMKESQKWFLQDVETSQRNHLLLQHTAQLLLVLQCCSKLMTPYRMKKTKKKSKTPAIPTTSHNFDVHVYAVSRLLCHLMRHFSHDHSHIHQTAKTQLIAGHASDKACKMDALADRMYSNHVMLHSGARDLITKWTAFLQSVSNANFTPDTEELAVEVEQNLVL